MATITLRPTSASGNSWRNLSNAYDGNSNSYATSPSVTFNNHTNYRATFNFDVSSLTGKTINSATLTVRAEVGFTGEMRLYADINTAGSNRVISTDLISTYSVTNYTANIANYINNLSSVIVTPAQITVYDNNINIYEVWIDVDYTTTTATTYTVRFLDWDNSVISTQTVTSGGSATPPPNPTRDGYTFTGWLGDYTNVTANVDIIAQYTKNSSGGDDTSVKNIKIGNSTIDKLYLGTSQILKAYLGNILLYSFSTGGGSGGEISPPSSGKNLFNKETAKLNTVVNPQGIGSELTFGQYNGNFTSDYIEVKPNTEYVISYNGVQSKKVIVYHLDKDKKALSSSQTNPFTTVSNTKYIVLVDSMNNIDTIQLEEGSTPTDYEPYQ